MARVVMKFGGTSVGSVDRIHHVAERVKSEVDAGNEVAVVVSAMSGETDRLIALVEEIRGGHKAADAGGGEYDMVVSAGEQISSGLLALALNGSGIAARSWAAWQLPLRTKEVYGQARIQEIETDGLIDTLQSGEVAVIAGFQGLAESGRIATLGRGGTDTSAVAVAAAIKADRCDIYTDVDGVYTTDPRIVQKAHRLDRVSYEEMLEMASLGAKVLQTRSVELAMVHEVPLRVLSSFNDLSKSDTGTLVCKEDDIVESLVVSGITYSRDEARVNLLQVKDEPGVAAKIFGLLADANINVDMIVQNVSRSSTQINMTFTVKESDLQQTLEVLGKNKQNIGYNELSSDSTVAKVSVVGVGMRSHAGTARTMFKALADKGINIQVIATSEIKISVLIDEEYTELALRTLHTAYDLDTQDE